MDLARKKQYIKEKYIPTETIVMLAKERGVNFGFGDYKNRIRYFIKFGLLPHQQRINIDGKIVPHLPEDSLERLVQIQKLMDENKYSIQDIISLNEQNKLSLDKTSNNVFLKIPNKFIPITTNLSDSRGEKINQKPLVSNEFKNNLNNSIKKIVSKKKYVKYALAIVLVSIFFVKTSSFLVGNVEQGHSYVISHLPSFRQNNVLGDASTSLAEAATNLDDSIFIVSIPTEFRKDIIAPNVIYSVEAGTGLSIEGDQNLKLSNTGVLTIGGQSGSVNLLAGAGISVNGLTITNNDKGSDQKIFSEVRVVDGDSIQATTNTDILELEASGRLNIEVQDNKLVFSADQVDASFNYLTINVDGVQDEVGDQASVVINSGSDVDVTRDSALNYTFKLEPELNTVTSIQDLDAIAFANVGQISATTLEISSGNFDVDASGNVFIPSGLSVYIGSVKLNDYSSPASGATLIGVYDEFANSSSTTVQGVLDDLDAAIGGGSSKWTQDTGFTYLTETANKVVVGSISDQNAKLGIVGTSDSVQLKVIGYTSQVSNLVEFQNSSLSNVFSVANNGSTTIGPVLTFSNGEKISNTTDGQIAIDLTSGGLLYVDEGGVKIGGGAPSVSQADGSLYVTGTTEVDGATRIDNTLTLNPTGVSALVINPYGANPGETSGVEFRELAANGSNYVSFKAPDSLSTNYTYTLPNSYGSNGYFLSSDGAGGLTWLSLASGGAITTVGDVSGGAAFSGLQGNTLYFEGSTVDTYEIALTGSDATADRTITLPNSDGVLLLDANIGVTVQAYNANTSILGSDISLTSEVSGTLPVSNGGTGSTTLTLNGVLFGDGTDPINSTSAPTAGQLLIGSAGGVPTFVDAGGDISIAANGIVTILADSVALGTDTTGSFVSAVDAGSGLLSTGASSGEGIAHVLSIGAGNGITVNADDVAVNLAYDFAWTGLQSWTNTVAATGSQADFNLTLGNDADVDTVSAVKIDVTSANTGDADNLSGINIASLTSADSTVIESAIFIGANWDSVLNLNGITLSASELGLLDGLSGSLLDSSSTLLTLSADSGSDQTLVVSDTIEVSGGTNGIDTVASATDTVTLNLDTTEIGTTTFGSGTSFTWTFDASAGTDTTIAYGNDSITISAGNTNFNGSIDISGGITSGTGNAFSINSSGAIAAATGITSSGTITFSGLSTDGIVLNNASGVLSTTSTIGSAYITDDSIVESDLNVTNAPTAGYVLTYDAGGGFTWVDSATSGDISAVGSCTTGACFVDGTNNTLTFEGSTTDSFESILSATDPTADRSILIPDADGTIIVSGHAFTGDVAATLGSAGTTSLTIQANSVALGTDTTGNYVATVDAGNGLASTGATTGEGIGHVLSITAGNGIVVSSDGVAVDLAYDFGWTGLHNWTNTLTDNGSQADFNLALGNDANADIIKAINIDATSANTGDADSVIGLNVSDLASADATVTESAIFIGANWDAALNLNGTLLSSTELGLLDGRSGTLLDTNNVVSQLSGWDQNSSDDLTTATTLLTLSGDTGSDQTLTSGNTLEVAGGSNGIDTVGTATDTITLNLDTTEIGTTTFGSGSAFTWTFDASAGTDTTIAFGNNTISLIAATTSVSGDINITGNDIAFGNGETISNATDGVMAITSGSTTVSGTFDVASSLAVGTADAFTVNTSGAITAATGITSSGTITFSALNSAGIVLNSSSGVLSTTSTIGSAYITDDSILEADLDVSNSPTDDYILTYDLASGGFTWVDPTSVGAGDITAVGDCINGACFVDGTNNTLTFEGSSADTFESTLSATNPTADRAILLPDADGTIIVSGHTFTGDVAATLGSAGTTALTIQANSVALGTDTTNDYVAAIIAGSGLASTGATSGETISHTLSIGAGNGITVNADDVAVNLAYDFAWTGLHSWTNTITTNGSQTDFNLTLGNDADADTVSAVNVDVTSAATGDADNLRGINIAALTSADATVIESAIFIGANWDAAINLNGTLLSSTELGLLDGRSGTLLDTNNVATELSGWDQNSSDDLTTATTLLTLSGDTGSDQTLTSGNTLEVAGGSNGIDTVGTATDTITLNLDTTEIGTTTFGSGSAFTWTFDASAGTDTTIAFGNNTISLTAATTSVSGDLTITGDDLYLTTNTAGYFLVADGTNFNPVAASGDVALSGAGAFTIQDNSVDGTDIALGSDATGDIMYYNGTDWVRLPVGSAGNVLTVSSGAPAWLAESGDITDVVAGLGLTGGGSTGSVTLDLGAGAGISVAANDVAVDASYAFAWTGLQSWTSSLTNTSSIQDINLALVNDADVDVISALNIDVTSANTADADVLYGVNINNVTSADATVTETALRFGSAWDNAFEFEGTTNDAIETYFVVTDPTSSDKTITIPNASGELSLLGQTIETSEITDGTVLEGDLSATNSATNGYILSYDNASGGFTWISNTGGTGSSKWTDTGSLTYLTDTTDDLAVGGSTSDASLYFVQASSALNINPYGASAGNTGEIRLQELEANGDNYTGIKAPDSLTASVIYTLPTADATVGNQVLASDGAGNLSWIDVSGGAGGYTGWSISDGTTSQSISTGNTLLAADSSTINAVVTATDTLTYNVIANSLDFSELKDSLTLDASTSVATGNSYTYSVNSSLTAGARTADVFAISLANDVTNNFTSGNLFTVDQLDTGSSADLAEFTNAGTGNSFVVNDATSDTTPFVIDANGNVGVGTAGPDAKIDLLATSGAQLRTTYTDGSVYTDFTTNSSGNLSIDTSGTSVTIADDLIVSGNDLTFGNAESISNTTDGVISITSPSTNLSGDLTVTGNDIAFGNGETISNATDGTVLITSPTTTVSGDLTISGDDLFLATNTSGYLLVADGTNFNPVAASGDISLSGAGAFTIQDNSVDGTDISLGSDATGDVMYYNGTDWVRLAAGLDGTVLTLASGIPSWATAAGDITAVGDCTNGACFVDGTNNTLTFEGSSADTFESTLSATNPTADRSILIPDADGTIIVSGHTFTGDVAATLGSAGTTALTIQANSVALGTDTTNDYVAAIIAGSGLASTGATSGETISHTLSIGAGTGITVNADDVAVNLAYDFAWTGLHSWTNTITTNGSQTDFNLTLGNDADADTVSAVNVDVTSAATGDADNLRGINIAALTSADATVIESAIFIGANWDAAINLNGTLLSSTELGLLDGRSGTLLDTNNVATELSGWDQNSSDDLTTATTLLTLSGDSGSDQTLTSGNTLEVAGGSNGIDTVGTATDTITLNLDTTEIGTTTFGSGSAFTWTFDASAGTDTTIAFGNNTISLTAATTSVSGDLTVTGNDITFGNAETISNATDGTVLITSPTTTVSGDLTISGDDLFMATNTAGYFLVADGTNFNPVAASGDVALSGAGAFTIQDNSVDGTDIALGSDATGDVMYYNGTDWVRLAAGLDGTVLTLASGIPSWANSAGDITAVGNCSSGDCFVDGTNNTLTFEGSTADTFESTLSATDPTADRSILLPNEDGTIIVSGHTFSGDVTATLGTGGTTALTVADDILDFTEFLDSMTLDASLVIAQAANTWSQTYSGSADAVTLTNSSTGSFYNLIASGVGTTADGIKIANTSSGVITDAIDLSDAEIVNAINVGANTILGTNAVIDFSEFDVSGTTGSITINDDGDLGNINIEGTVLDINSLDFTGAGAFTSGTNQNLAFTAGGTGDYVFNVDSDTLLSVTGGAAGTNVINVAGGDVTLASGDLILAGRASSTSTTEGAIYYDSDDDQLKVYANGKWQADRTTSTVLVGASDSKNKDKAEFVTDGSGGTDDSTTIESALAALPSQGGAVILLDGTYYLGSDITFNKSNVMLLGQGKSTKLVRAYDNGTMVKVQATTSVDLKNIKIANMHFDGLKATYTNVNNSSIHLQSRYPSSANTLSDVIIENIYFENAAGESIYAYGGGATYAVKDLTIRNVEMTTGGKGIYFANYVTDSLIDGAYIYSNVDDGIYLASSSSYNTITNSVIDGNTSTYGVYLGATNNKFINSQVKNQADYGLYAPSANITISNNIFSTNGDATRAAVTVSGNNSQFIGNQVLSSVGASVYVSSASDSVISDNVIQSSGDDAFYVTSSDYVAISNNNILTVTGIGIRLGSSNYAVVTGNVINGATTNSIYLTSADFNTVTDNKIYNGGGSGSSDGIYLASTANDSNYIVNNSIYDTAGTGQAVDIDGGTSNTIAGNIYSGTGATALELASGVVQTGQLDSSSNIIYNPTGNFGINTTGPDAKLDTLATSGEQLRLSYTDGSVYTGFTVDSGGDLTVNGTGNDVNFSDAINGTFVNSAAGSANALSLSGTLGAFDGSDTFRGVYLNYTNTNHTGASNVFNGLDIAGITGDAEATETALNIGAGWDSGITSASAITISGGADLNITAATDLVFGGTTTLGEATSATDSGAYLVGVFDEFTYSSSSTVQAVLNDLDAAISSSGDITDVGSCSTGACFVDGTNNTLTFEGSSTDTFESVLSATNPTADRSILIPDADGTIIVSGHTFTGDVTATLGTAGTTALTVADNILNFTEFADSLSLDATTEINAGANQFNIDLDSTGTFDIRDGSTTFVSFDDDSTIDITFPAAGTIGIDAATTDNTTTDGVFDLNVDTTTNNNIGFNIDSIIRDSAGITAYGAKINQTIDTDAAESSTGYGLYLSSTNNDVSSTAIGLSVNMTGTGTQYAALFNGGNVGIGSSVPEALLEIQGAEATDAVIALDADDGDDAADTWFIKSEASTNNLSVVNNSTEVFALGSTGNLQIDGDLTISGNDIVFGNAETISNSTDGVVAITSPSTTFSGDITVTGNDITFGNAETISNSTDGVLAITSPSTTISGGVTITPFSTAGIVINNASGVLSSTATIGSSYITDDSISATDLDATLTFADGDFLNLSSINVSSTTEGLILPQATSCASGTAEGQICWDTDNDTLYVGNSSSTTALLTSATTLFATTSDLGTGSIVNGDDFKILGGINGVDTALSGDVFTISLDTTEITDSTFGSGLGSFVWTFNAGVTDPTITWGSDAITTGTSANGLFNVTTGNLKVGDATPDVTLNGEDLYVEGTFENDGAARFDGAITANSTYTQSSSSATGSLASITGNSLTTGTGLSISSSSTALSSGGLLALSKTASSGSTAFTGDIINGVYSQTFNGGVGLSSTGNVLDLSRAITLNNSGNTHTISGAVATISDSATQTAGTLTSTANVLEVSQSYTGNTGAALNVTTGSTNGGLALRINDDGTLTDSTPFVVDQTGKIGIGIAAPVSALELASGQVSLPAGSAGSPSLSFTGDLNTGFYSPAAEKFGFVGNGQNILYGDGTSGAAELGIGVDPGATLDVYQPNSKTENIFEIERASGGVAGGQHFGTVSNTGIWNLTPYNTGSTAPFTISVASTGDSSIQLASDGNQWTIGADSSDSDNFKISDNTALGTNDRLTIDSTTGLVTVANDLTISGDDLFMATNTSGFILVADGTNFNPVDLSGDIDISSTGVTSFATDIIDWADFIDASTLDNSTSVAAGNSYTFSVNGSLTSGARTADVFKIELPQDATNNFTTGNLLTIDQLDLLSSADLAEFTNAGTGNSFVVNDVASDTTPFVIDASGNVGIGVATTTAKLDISSPNGVVPFNIYQDAVDSLIPSLGTWATASGSIGQFAANSFSGTGTFLVLSQTGKNLGLGANNSYAAPSVLINTSGNVGVGTLGPDARLDTLATSGAQLRTTYTDGSVYTDFTTNSSGNLSIDTSGTTVTIADDLTVSGGDINGVSGVNIDLGEATASTAQFYISSTSELSLNATNLFATTAEGNSLGSTTNEWESLYLGNGNGIFFGLNQDWTFGYDSTDTRLELVTAGTTGVQLSTATVSGKALQMNADSATNGRGLDLSIDALTTGDGIYIESTSTTLTSGSLERLYWNPGSATTATGDLFKIDTGANATVSGNILGIYNNASLLLGLDATSLDVNVPASFNNSGDLSAAYDMYLTNQTASAIESYGPLTITSGESFENNNLTLKAYGTGTIAVSGSGLSLETGEKLIVDSNDSSDSYFMHSNSGNYVSAFADNVEVVRFNTDSSVDGNTTFDANAFDIAEYYPTQDQTIEGGDVVVLTKNTDVSGDFSTYLIEKSQAANKDQVLGVISTNPGFTMGGGSFRSEFCSAVETNVELAKSSALKKEIRIMLINAELPTELDVNNNEIALASEVERIYSEYSEGNYEFLKESKLLVIEDKINTCKAEKQIPVALSGRIPVKFDLSNGEIKAGDLLTVSTIVEGKAMKATEKGWIIGRALEDADITKETVMMFTSLTWFDPANSAPSVSDLTNIEPLNLNDLMSVVTINDKAKIAVYTDMVSTGNISATDYTVLGKISAGLLTIDGTNESISTFGGKDLLLQSDATAGSIKAFGEKFIIDTNGNLTSTGELRAEKIAAKEFKVLGASNTQNSTIGESTINSGQTSITILNNKVTANSKIFVTATNNTFGKQLYVSNKSDGSFTVSLSDSVSSDVNFDFWIVAVEN